MVNLLLKTQQQKAENKTNSKQRSFCRTLEIALRQTCLFTALAIPFALSSELETPIRFLSPVGPNDLEQKTYSLEEASPSFNSIQAIARVVSLSLPRRGEATLMTLPKLAVITNIAEQPLESPETPNLKPIALLSSNEFRSTSPRPPKRGKEALKESLDCSELIRYFERRYDIPTGLLAAIAWVESRGHLWAINNLSSSRYCKSQEEAIIYVRQLERSNQPSISIGCMQVNWQVHKDQFADLNEALTPYYNIKFAAKLLKSLYKRFGSWEKAIGWYNPKGNKPNRTYVNLVCHCMTEQHSIKLAKA